MATAVWTGTLSFGLITLPVRLYPATQPKDVRFHLYDREGRRIRYQRVVETDETSPGSDLFDAARTERGEEEAPLVGGGEHDWAFLLGRAGWLEHDQGIAGTIYLVGALLYVVAIVGGWIFLRQPADAASNPRRIEPS